DDSDVEATERVSILVKSKAAWRKQLAKWQEELQDAEAEAEAGSEGDDEDGGEDLPSTISASAAPRNRRPLRWLPTTLANLYGGTIPRPIGKPARRPRVVSEESLYMELLAAEYSDEDPDAGAQEGSGDDFEE
ncbi:hypothetical protein B0H14DRAFT_2269212, partial [Mycena olivaceomarginata]